MQRIISLDLARGFIVLVMPSVHVVMLYSHPEVQQSLLGVILQFLAEGPGAQLFMLIMGASIHLSKSITPKKVLQRTIHLFAGAILLNFFKFIIPLELELLPTTLLKDFPLSNFEFLLMGDIFLFAAFAYPVTYIISRLKHYATWTLLIAIAIMLLSSIVWDVKTGNIFVDQVMIYFTGKPPFCFFPLFPWLVYPLTGLAIASVIASRKIATIGAAIVVISLLFPATKEYTSFYRTLPADTLFHIGIVLLWLSLFNYASKKMKMNAVSRLLIFCSQNISLVYVLQWLLIFWCFPLAGYQHLDILQSLYWMTAISATTLLLTYALKKSDAYRKSI